jgi:hypothetical protein
MSNVLQGMGAGIGTPIALNIHLLPEKFACAPQETPLDGFCILLLLPATVTAAIVLQNEFKSFVFRGHTNITAFSLMSGGELFQNVAHGIKPAVSFIKNEFKNILYQRLQL